MIFIILYINILVTDDHHFKDQKIFYQFRLDVLNIKLGDIVDIEDTSSISNSTKANFHSETPPVG